MDREALMREAAEEALLRESEDRKFLYKDVIDLLSTGFLVETVFVEGVPIVFRTLSQRETATFLIRAESVSTTNWKRYYLCHSVHMINGFAVEPQYGGNHAYHLYHEWGANLHFEMVEVLYAYTTSLRNRLNRAVRLTDAYCHETYSRSQWRMLKPFPVRDNVVQRLWASYNEVEDQYEADLKQWAHTRAIAGSMSNKASKALVEAEEKWRTRREDRSRRVIEDAVNWVISGERAEQEPLTVTVNGQTYEVPKVHASQTVEELQEEMMRAVRGEKDYHDLLVDEYKAFHRERLRKAQEEQRAAMEKVWGDQEAGLQGSIDMVGYTAEQLAQINPDLARKKPNTQRAAVSPQNERFHKYLDTEVRAGWLGLQGPEEAKPPPEAGEKPSEGSTLQEKISRRVPRLKP